MSIVSLASNVFVAHELYITLDHVLFGIADAGSMVDLESVCAVEKGVEDKQGILPLLLSTFQALPTQRGSAASPVTLSDGLGLDGTAKTVKVAEEDYDLCLGPVGDFVHVCDPAE
ncbi:hypothetical protein EYZ11_013427 [Aspergillus tanneri]|uniref:Uncharacterized protein n=1 Tax=Aspergillus tanneri TaxID=1220188 RepID=A0A4S3IZW6_9EURO|nr:hypothetical protein EYZ11_013427 [Aspergillus tanneri]